MILVTVNRKEHVCKNLHQFASAVGIIEDLVGHGSVPCRPLLGHPQRGGFYRSESALSVVFGHSLRLGMSD